MTDGVPHVSVIPEPLIDIVWGCGVGSVRLVLRLGTGLWRGFARAGMFETGVYWTYSMRTEEGEGELTRYRLLPGDAPTLLSAAMRGLALLSAIGLWSKDLSEYVLSEAGA